MRQVAATLVVLLAGCEWFGDDGAHGIVRLELRSEASQDERVFQGTDRIASRAVQW